MRRAKSGLPVRLVFLAALAGALLVPSLTLALAAQNPPPRQPPAHAKKVWTEDDLAALRTRSDLYQMELDKKADAERAAREAEAAAAKDAAAHPAKPDQPAAAPAAATPQIPSNPEEIRSRIEVVRKQIADLGFEAQKAHQDLLDAREDQKSEVQAQNSGALEKLAKAQAELQALEDKLRELSPPPAS
jgi:hypothetical protein